MYTLINVLRILAMGVFDRVRGSGWFRGNHIVGQIGMGITTALILKASWMWGAYIVVAVCLGAAPGWMCALSAAFNGTPMGTGYDAYQKWPLLGFTQRSLIAALFVRGLLWGILLVPYGAVVNHHYLLAPLAFAIPFTATPYLTRWFVPAILANKWMDKWGYMELMRGLMVGELLTLL